MIERIARAMAEDSNGGSWYADYTQEQKELWKRRARVALDTLRVPTDRMLEEGPPEPYMDAEVWARMIGAELR